MAYMQKRGSLNVGTRVEVGAAVIAATVGQSVGAKVTAHDFMSHVDKPEATIDDVMKILSGVKR